MSDFSTPSARHLALTTRNSLATSAFTYAVLTTRIYCRPDCPSRLARRANIHFFDTAAEAAAAGFRACKRCVPDGERRRSGRAQEEVLERACRGVRERVRGGGGVEVGEVARGVGWTKGHFCRVFRRVRGVTVGEWVRGLEREVGRNVGRNVERNVERVDAGLGAEAEVDRGVDVEEVDWEEWLDYSDCSTPGLVPLTFPYLN
ncbi:hypothetical protein MMC30_003259 [Trapelia coarctata]|nr:hypothetical protein [Trapelia coarctata]